MAMPPAGVPPPADLLETFREKVVRDLFWALAGPNLSNVSIKQICRPLGARELMMEPSPSANFTLLSSLGRSSQESIAQLRAWDQDPLPLLKLLRERGGLSLRTLGHYFSTLLEVWFLSSPNVVGIKKGQTVRLRSDKTSTKVLRESQLKFLLFLRGKESVSSDEKKAPESTPTIPEASEQGPPDEGEKAAPEQDFIDTPNLPLEASTGPVFHVEANIKFFVLTRSGSVKGPFLHESLQNRIEDIERKLELLHAVPELKSNAEKFSGYLLRGYVFHQIDAEDLDEDEQTKADVDEDAGETETEDAGSVGATGAGRMRKTSAEPAVEVANGHFEHAFEGGIRSQEDTRTEASRENKKHDPASALDSSLLDAEHASGFLTRHVRNIAHESCCRPGFNVTTKYVVLPKLYWLSPLTGAPLRYLESGFRCRKDQADATVETAYLELFGSCQQILAYDTIDLLEKYARDFFLRNKDIPIMVAVVEVLVEQDCLHEVRRGFVLPHWWSPTNPEGHLLQIQNRARAFPPKRESRTRARQRLEREARQRLRNTAHGKCNLLLQEAWELAGGVVTLELGGTGRSCGSGTIDDLREEDAEEGSCSLGQKLRDAESGIIRGTEEELQRAGERTSPSEPTPAQSAALRVRWHRALEGMKRQLQMQAVGKKKGKRGYRHDHKARKCGGGVELEVERTDEKLREMEGGTGKTPRPMLQQELQQDAEACENESKPVVLDAEADPDPDAVDADAITGTEKASSTVGTRTPAAPEDVKICVEWLLDAIFDSSPAGSRIEPLLLAKAFLQLFPYSTLAAAAHFQEPAMPLVDDGRLCEQSHRKGKREETETAESESKSAQDLQDAGRGEATGGGPKSATSAAFTDKVARTVVQSRFRGDAKYDLRTCLAGPAGVRLLPALPLLGVFDIPADALPAFRSAVFSSPQKTALKVLSEFEAHHLTSAPEKESTDGYCRDPDYFGTKLVNEYFTHLQQRVRDPPPPVLGVDGTPVVERPRALEIGGIEPNYGHNMQQEAVVMPPDEQAVNTQHRKWEKFNTGASSDRDDHHRWLRLPPEVPIIVVEDVTRDAAPILTQEQDFFDEDNDAAASDGIRGCKTQKYTVGLDCEWAPGFIGTGDLGVSLVQLAFPHCVLLVDFVAVGDETGQRLVSEILARFACRVVAFGKEDFRRLKLLRPTGDDSAESSRLSNSATTSSRAYTGPSTAGTGAAASTCPESSRRSPGSPLKMPSAALIDLQEIPPPAVSSGGAGAQEYPLHCNAETSPAPAPASETKRKCWSSMAELCARVFRGYVLDKRLQCAPWHRLPRPLAAEYQHYAALDAYLALATFRALRATARVAARFRDYRNGAGEREVLTRVGGAPAHDAAAVVVECKTIACEGKQIAVDAGDEGRKQAPWKFFCVLRAQDRIDASFLQGLGARVVTPVEVAAKFGFPLFGVGPFHPSNATPTSSRTPKNEKTRPRSTVFMDTRVTEYLDRGRPAFLSLGSGWPDQSVSVRMDEIQVVAEALSSPGDSTWKGFLGEVAGRYDASPEKPPGRGVFTAVLAKVSGP